ncbi:MAG: type III pantothenate kinase [Alphaproteobacteria bacterium]|nr:type III pantothenate kinase [Alphaproteobacteria bacterium]MBU0798385.1 type III pantothenate kinase [Alphaproteobacteria bacterium]MBU0887800.1 type III pantothenate kinase [Alphaproteobacteria bacterium]MBU1814977.1 type III pantothenate kinase [Alphaproteobacteria bacterium]MBU2090685.1 type III pantothenate kinase [Alphaproteobacteria bacterium]
MLLAINSNNTNIKFGLFDGDEERAFWRIGTDTKRTADEYAVWISQLMTLKGMKSADVTECLIASVVPDTLYNLKMLCRSYFNCEPLIYTDPDVLKGTIAKVDRPEEVGADRLVNTVATHHLYGGPAIVVDFGTATTFDVVDADGNYCGGVIAPGINLSIEALRMAAALLPRVAVRRPEKVIGSTTVGCFESGIFWGYISLIEGLVARIRAEFGQPMKVVATGGLVPVFADATDIFDHLDQDLTMRGLVIINRLNRTQ